MLVPRSPPARPPRLDLCLPPRPDSLAAARARVRSWLDDLGASGTEVDDLVLACSEACANSVENAADLPGPNALIVRGRVLAGSIVSLRVRDYGRWRFAPRRPGRGRGLELIRRLADQVAILRRADGTEVTFYRRLELPARRSRAGTIPSGDGHASSSGGPGGALRSG